MHLGITYTVEGVADAVNAREGIVEELKLLRRSGGDSYTRLRCHAYFLACAKNLRRVKMRMRFVDPDSGEVTTKLACDKCYEELMSFMKQEKKDSINLSPELRKLADMIKNS
jgi:hypothetical protein